VTLLMRQVRITQRATYTQRMFHHIPLFARNARAYIWYTLRSNGTPVGYTYRMLHRDDLETESANSIPFIYGLWLLVNSVFNNLSVFIVS
jgi:hypothetical protein